MPDAVAYQLAVAVQARLALVSGIAELELAPPGDPAAFPALHLEDSGDAVVSQDYFTTRSRLQMAVIGYVKGAGQATLQAARNLDAAVVAQLMADQQLGGLATEILLGGLLVEPVELAETRTVAFRRSFEVDFSFRTTDPTAVGG